MPKLNSYTTLQELLDSYNLFWTTFGYDNTDDVNWENYREVNNISRKELVTLVSRNFDNVLEVSLNVPPIKDEDTDKYRQFFKSEICNHSIPTNDIFSKTDPEMYPVIVSYFILKRFHGPSDHQQCNHFHILYELYGNIILAA